MQPIVTCGQCRAQVIPLATGACPACGGDPAIVRAVEVVPPPRVSGRYLVHAALWLVLGCFTIYVGQVVKDDGWRRLAATALPWVCFVGGLLIAVHAIRLRLRERRP